MQRTTFQMMIVVTVLLTCTAVFALASCEESPASSPSASSRTDTTASDSASAARIEVVNQVVEASCGECNFGMEGMACDLAVRIDGKAYFVDGAALDDFGDAHAADGLCNSIRRARVTGHIDENGRFVAGEIELLPPEDEEGRG